MSVFSLSTSVSYTSNGTSTTYAVPFYFMAFTDLVVMSTATGVTTTSPINTGWVGTGTANSMGAYNAGGSIVFQSGQIPASGAVISIVRFTSRTQPLTFPDFGPLSGPALENALDRLTLIEQEALGTALGGGFLGLAPGPPTTGNYLQGQFLINSVMQAGNPFGWACVTSGAPGVWSVITSLSL